jgi:hypothetical protein
MHHPNPLESIFELAVRYFIFTAAIFITILTIIYITPSYGAALFSEGSPLEWAHVIIMALAAAVFFRTVRAAPSLGAISLLLAHLPLLAVSRELDNFFKALIPFFGWQLPFYLVFASGAFHFWRKRVKIFAELPTLCTHRAFALMWSGLMIAIPFAQLVGHGPFLEALFGEDYERPMKRVIEEVSETVGYVIILLAAIDWSMYAARLEKSER